MESFLVYCKASLVMARSRLYDGSIRGPHVWNATRRDLAVGALRKRKLVLVERVLTFQPLREVTKGPCIVLMLDKESPSLCLQEEGSRCRGVVLLAGAFQGGIRTESSLGREGTDDGQKFAGHFCSS